MTVDVGVEGLVAELDQELKHERRRNYQGIGALASWTVSHHSNSYGRNLGPMGTRAGYSMTEVVSDNCVVHQALGYDEFRAR